MNTDKPFLEKMVEVTREFNGKIYNHTKPETYKDGYERKKSYQLIYTDPDDVQGLLKEVLPYLIIKKEKAISAIKWVKDEEAEHKQRSTSAKNRMNRTQRGKDGKFIPYKA